MILLPPSKTPPPESAITSLGVADVVRLAFHTIVTPASIYSDSGSFALVTVPVTVTVTVTIFASVCVTLSANYYRL